jgi:hypothetical protein
VYTSASTLAQWLQAFRSLGQATGVELCYGLLIDGLLHCLMSKRDPAGIVAAENDLLNAIGEYRKICPAGKNRESLFKLLFIQKSLAQKEGTRLVLQEYNSLASQAFFKKSRGNLDAARKLAEGMEDILRQVDDYERQGRGMSLFGEGFILQERGAHAQAAIRFQESEVELGQLKSSVDLAFERWAKAAQDYAIAADRFPNDEDAYYTNAARMRFYADASLERANSALARANGIEVQLHKGRKPAGLIFFGLWILSGAGTVAALKFLSQSVSGFEFITVLIITFVGSMLAAELIKPSEAMQKIPGSGAAGSSPERSWLDAAVPLPTTSMGRRNKPLQ